MYSFEDENHEGGTVPVAGYRYGSKGLSIDKAGSIYSTQQGELSHAIQQDHLILSHAIQQDHLAALDALREALKRSSERLASREIVVDEVRRSLLWLRVDSTWLACSNGNGGKAEVEEEEDEEEALRAYPSEHTCLVCNVVALESLLREGRASRFAARGSIPPVYLSCACNFDRDDETGEVNQ